VDHVGLAARGARAVAREDRRAVAAVTSRSAAAARSMTSKQADIVLLRLPASHDPIGTVVTAAHPGNVDTVLVAGRVRKSGETPARYAMSESLLAGLPCR